MKISTRLDVRVLTVAALIAALPACTLRGTTAQVSDTTRNTTMTTSGKSWFTGEGLVKAGQQADAFADLNFENVKQDMALGHGEYLASLGMLLGIPDQRQGEFFSLAQGHYTVLVPSEETTPGQMLAALDRELAASMIPISSGGMR